MNFVAIIPARYSSLRLPGKPLQKIAGKPMIEHVYSRVKACQYLKDVIVATDDERILDCVHSFGGKAELTSDDSTTGTDRVAEVASRVSYLDDLDVVINVQGDQPLVNMHSLDELCAACLKQPLTVDEMITLVIKLKPEQRDNPNHVKVVIDSNFNAIYFSRLAVPYGRDDWQHPMYKHLGIYGYSLSFLRKFVELEPPYMEQAEKLEQLRALFYGYSVKLVETEFDSPEVDVREDIDFVEQLLKR